MATEIPLQGDSGASQRKRRYGTWPAQMMRRGFLAMRDGSWEEFEERYREEEKSPDWTLERIREAYEQVAKDGRLGNVHDSLRKSAAFVRRVIAPVGVTLSFFLPALQQFSFGGLHLVGIDGTRRQQQEALQLVVCGVRGANTNGGHPTGY